MRTFLLGIVVAVLSAGCGNQVPAASANPPTEIRRPASVPNDFVVTPFGYFHPSCVAKLDTDESVRSDGIVEHKSGRTRALPRCAHSHFDRRGREIATDAIPPTIAHAYVEQADDFDEPPTPVSFMSASWTVPSDPTNKGSQTIYYFPGLEQRFPVTSILQPVLGWHSDFAGWGIASWNCCIAGTVTEGPAVAVSAGDRIYGYMTGTNCVGGVCSNWQVGTYDLTTWQSSTLNTSAYGQAFDWIFGGALEVYNVDSCDQYPASGSVLFDNLLIYDTNGNTIYPSYTPRISGGLFPQCGYNVTTNPSSVRVDANSLL